MQAIRTVPKEACPIPYTAVDVIVVGLHLRWKGVWQRPNHLLSRFAADVPVIVIEEPVVHSGPDFGTRHTVERAGNVTILTPHRRHMSDAIDPEAIAALQALLGDRRPLIWLYTPMMLALAEAFPSAPLVYDKMDELASFAHADPRIGQRESEILQRADIVFTGGRSLQRTIEARRTDAQCFPSGVDVSHFASAARIAPHSDIAPFRSGPVYGYIGVIDERLDLALIDAVAQAFPASTVVLIGPVVKIDPATLPKRANIAYLGPRGYDELPALLAGIDVALMPFALNDHTRNISPTKTLEYLAAGRPVVSTPIADVIADHGDVVAIASDTPAFIAAIAREPHGEPERTGRAAGSAANASWDAIADAMRAHMERAGIALGEVPTASAASR